MSAFILQAQDFHKSKLIRHTLSILDCCIGSRSCVLTLKMTHVIGPSMMWRYKNDTFDSVFTHTYTHTQYKILPCGCPFSQFFFLKHFLLIFCLFVVSISVEYWMIMKFPVQPVNWWTLIQRCCQRAQSTTAENRIQWSHSSRNLNSADFSVGWFVGIIILDTKFQTFAII